MSLGSKKQELHLGGEKSFSYISVLLSGLALLVVMILSWYVFDKSEEKKGEENIAKQTDTISIESASFASNQQSEVVEVAQKVSKHIMLPKGDITVATVTDADLLRSRNPAYFQFVKNGDKIIRYPLGLIIYDMEQDRIVDLIRFFPEQADVGENDQNKIAE